MIGKGLDYEHAMCVCFGSDFDGTKCLACAGVSHVALSLLGLGTG